MKFSKRDRSSGIDPDQWLDNFYAKYVTPLGTGATSDGMPQDADLSITCGFVAYLIIYSVALPAP